ncbi:MAG: glycogen synthase [Rikenellaceae bacterium]|nr:glycogen synthase [Rikenellaceae bacterium]
MANNKILYICQQIMPYLPENEESCLCRQLSQAMQEHGNEIRTFMPRYGCVNERRNQLHEVIRLSGMNLIINDDDHQLIIKVSSIPSARIQIYFIDNDDFFSRKAVLANEEGKAFEDNDARMMFFARGVLETVKKLQWRPSVVHCHGWFSAIAPIYLRNMFKDDPVLCGSKIVVSLYEDRFSTPLDAEFAEKLVNEGVDRADVAKLGTPSYENLMRFVIDNVDGVVVGSESADKALIDYARESGKKILEYRNPEDEGFYDNYDRFYEELF